MAAHGTTTIDEFNQVVEAVRNGTPNPKVSTEDKLKVYALFKQATVGDVQGSQPWAVQVEARMKWDAWNALKGMSKDEAKAAYVAEHKRQLEVYA